MSQTTQSSDNHGKEHRTDNVIENKPINMSFADATFFLGAITAWSYLWAYLYELGSKDFYKVPGMFIEVDTSTVLQSFGDSRVVLITLLAVSGLTHMITKKFLQKKEKKEWVLIGVLVLVLVLITAGISMIPINVYPLIYYIPLPMMMILTAHLLSTDNFRYLFVSFCTVYILFVSYLLGTDDAKNQEEYLVLEMRDKVPYVAPYVVIDTYGQYFLIAPLNEASKEITPYFQLIEQKKASQQLYQLKLKKIGPLQVK